MKRKAEHGGSKRHPASTKAAKPTCGTLSYLSESRGAIQKAGPIRSALPDSVDKNVRK
jgi:hypothetical protein